MSCHGLSIVWNIRIVARDIERNMKPTGLPKKAEAASCETASLFLQHMVDELVLVCHKVGSFVKDSG